MSDECRRAWIPNFGEGFLGRAGLGSRAQRQSNDAMNLGDVLMILGGFGRVGEHCVQSARLCCQHCRRPRKISISHFFCFPAHFAHHLYVLTVNTLKMYTQVWFGS